MKMKNVKEKVKNFYEEHKAGCMIAGATGLVVIGEVVGWKCCWKCNGLKPGRNIITHDVFNACINNAKDVYKDGCSAFTLVTENPIKLDEMGKFSDAARELGFDMTQELTHFMAIGKPMIEK